MSWSVHAVYAKGMNEGALVGVTLNLYSVDLALPDQTQTCSRKHFQTNNTKVNLLKQLERSREIVINTEVQLIRSGALACM